MTRLKRLFPMLAVVFGSLGVVICIATALACWFLAFRLNRANEYVFAAVDKVLAAAHDRTKEVQRRVQQSKITAEEIGQRVRDRAVSATSGHLASRFEVEEKAEQLVLGLRQADQWLEVSEASIAGLQQALELGSSLGAPVDAALVAPLLEKIGLLRSELRQSVEMIDGIRAFARL